MIKKQGKPLLYHESLLHSSVFTHTDTAASVTSCIYQTLDFNAVVRLVLLSSVRPEVTSLRPSKQPLSSGLDDKTTALIIDYRPWTKHPRPSLSSCWELEGRESFPVRDASRFPVGQNWPSGSGSLRSVSLMCAFTQNMDFHEWFMLVRVSLTTEYTWD